MGPYKLGIADAHRLPLLIGRLRARPALIARLLRVHKVQLEAGRALISSRGGLLARPAERSDRVLQRAEHLRATVCVLRAGANLATAALYIASYRGDGSATVLARRRHANVSSSLLQLDARTTRCLTYSVVGVIVEDLVALRSSREFTTLGVLRFGVSSGRRVSTDDSLIGGASVSISFGGVCCARV